MVCAQPTVIAAIEHRAWTDDGKLRHAPTRAFQQCSTTPRSIAARQGELGGHLLQTQLPAQRRFVSCRSVPVGIDPHERDHPVGRHGTGNVLGHNDRYEIWKSSGDQWLQIRGAPDMRLEVQSTPRKNMHFGNSDKLGEHICRS